MECVERKKTQQQRQLTSDSTEQIIPTLDGETSLTTHGVGVHNTAVTTHVEPSEQTTTFDKTVLMVTVEFPPAQSSGVNRIQSFAHDLAAHGWRVIVLTTTPNVYPQLDSECGIATSLSSQVYRTKAVTSNQIFQLAGHYPAIVTIPDRYWPWLITAIPQGKKLIKEFSIDCIWSSYPYLSAHLVAQQLARNSKLPWVADFRDPLQCHYHQGYKHGNAFTLWLERRIVLHAQALCFVTEETRDLYRNLYPTIDSNKFHVIENGYSRLRDSAQTQTTERPAAPHIYINNDVAQTATIQRTKFTLLYSGGLYDGHRDPSPLFSALAELHQQGLVTPDNFVLRFRGAGDGQRYLPQLQREKITALVEFLPSVSQREAIHEILSADANLLIQGEIFNYQIPAKLYDYLQSAAPILAICPPQSATGRRCQAIAQCLTAWDLADIKTIIVMLLQRHQQQSSLRRDLLTPAQRQQLFSRQARSKELAQLLRSLCAHQVKQP